MRRPLYRAGVFCLVAVVLPQAHLEVGVELISPSSRGTGLGIHSPSRSRKPAMRADDRDDLLKRLESGDRAALDELTAILYDELRAIAHRQRSSHSRDATLATTALVHEVYLKLAGNSSLELNDRAHFLAVAAVAMRHILTDRARARVAARRGGGNDIVTLDEAVVASEDQPTALLQINDALTRLTAIDERLARIVEYRFFGGLTHEEIATVIGVTERTVERDWAKARLLLRDLVES